MKVFGVRLGSGKDKVKEVKDEGDELNRMGQTHLLLLVKELLCTMPPSFRDGQAGITGITGIDREQQGPVGLVADTSLDS